MGYDVQDLDMPRLSGRALRMLAAALENPVTGPALRRRLLQDVGMGTFRALVLDEAPTYHPLSASIPPPQDEPAPDLAAQITALLKTSTSDSPFAFTTVADYGRAYRAGETTPLAVAEAALAAIADSEAGPMPLRAFIAQHADDVRAQARAATARYEKGQPLGPFDGVPVAVKDEMDVAGYGTTLGTSFLGQTPAAQDATIVARMRAGGAVLLGKANMHEIGIGVTGLNAQYGTARNPYAPTHHTGGSSAGSAAAVAAGFCPVALAADGGGSIRVPSAFCGVVGLKATYGRISNTGAGPLDWSVGHLGPIAATVIDTALAYATIAGPDPTDPPTLHQPPATLDALTDADLSGLTLGIYTPWFEHADAAVVAACRAMVQVLQDHGAQVREVDLPELEALALAHVVTIASEMVTCMAPHAKRHRRDFGLDVRVNLALAQGFTARDYLHAQRFRTRAIAHFNRALGQVDAILTPATGVAAPPINEAALPDGVSDLPLTNAIMRFAVPGNLTGLPALSFPVGYTPQGLPIGMQAMGRMWDEAMLFRLAYIAEQHLERQAPQRFWRLLQNVAVAS